MIVIHDGDVLIKKRVLIPPASDKKLFHSERSQKTEQRWTNSRADDDGRTSEDVSMATAGQKAPLNQSSEDERHVAVQNFEAKKQ